MKRILCCLLPVLCALPGCDAVVGFFRPGETTVTLVNNSDFGIEVELFYDNDQNILESLLTEVGEELRYQTVPVPSRIIAPVIRNGLLIDDSLYVEN